MNYPSPLSRIVGLSALGAASLVFCSQEAAAQVVKCDVTSLVCSISTSINPKPRVESIQRLPTTIDTGWVPECSSNGPHCDKTIQFRAQIALDPPGTVDTSNPIWIVDMPKNTDVQVSWPDSNDFVVELVPTTADDGNFRVDHTLTPEIGIYFDALGFTTEVNLDANDLINLLPGAEFDYRASNNAAFIPWGFGGATMKVEGIDLNSSRLMSITFDELGSLVGSNGFTGIITGLISLNATTDTDFNYITDNIAVIGATGGITDPTQPTTIPINGEPGDFLEFTISPTGTIDYAGKLEFKPVIGITSIAGIGITLNFPIDVGIEVDYTSDDVPVNFPGSRVHIPLPNVFVPSSFVDFGRVDIGNKSATKSVIIDNTGELGATLEFESSDSQFSAEGVISTQVGPEQDYELELVFRPTKSGQQTATITVKSNDPNAPEQEFEVIGFADGQEQPNYGGAGGMGAGGVGGAPGGNGGSGASTFAPPAGDAAESDSGCGCRTPASQNTPGGAGLLALLGLVGLGGLRRRSRR